MKVENGKLVMVEARAHRDLLRKVGVDARNREIRALAEPLNDEERYDLRELVRISGKCLKALRSAKPETIFVMQQTIDLYLAVAGIQRNYVKRELTGVYGSTPQNALLLEAQRRSLGRENGAKPKRLWRGKARVSDDILVEAVVAKHRTNHRRSWSAITNAVGAEYHMSGRAVRGRKGVLQLRRELFGG